MSTGTSDETEKSGKREKSELLPFVEEEGDPPVDKFNLVFFVIMLHGVGNLMPWNMFITIAPTYFEKHKMVTHTLINGTVKEIPTEYAPIFMHWIGICSQWPSLILNFVNIFVTVKGDLSRRIVICIMFIGVIVFLTNCFVFIDTEKWIPGFFYMTMFSVVILNAANGVYQNSLYGLASDFPFKYTNAVIIGNNLCGTLVSLLSIISVEISSVHTRQAFFYFTISLFTIGACFLSFFYLRERDFYRYYSELGRIHRDNLVSEKGTTTWSDYWETCKQGWTQFLNVFLIFFVTLTIFPSVMVNVTSPLKGEAYDMWIPENQFANVFTFLLFNVFAFLGSLLAGYKQIFSPAFLWVPVWARVLFIPFFAMCNYRAEERSLSVWFPSLYVYTSGGAVMALSSGYLSSLAMMYAPRVVDSSKSRIAGMMAAFFLSFGIFTGLIFTITIPKMV